MPSRVVKSRFRQNLIRRDKNFRAAATEVLRDTGYRLKARHEDVVRDWRHKPKFVVAYTIRPDYLHVHVYADGKNAKIWRYVDEGTRPHKIVPRNPNGFLKFQAGYSARTAATAKYRVGSGRASGAWVQKREVNHPGNEAREFTETFSEEEAPEFRRNMENAFRRGLRS